jgi:NAD(P)H dehydrogenase (quinone)
MAKQSPILVTGVGGNVGGVGRKIVDLLRQRDLPVRAFVHRADQSDALKSIGAEVFVGDLTRAADVARALEGCRRMYFGMSVSAPYLQATVIAAAAAREIPDFEVLVNISQMTVSQMTLTNMTDSPQQQQHFLGEQALNWSGVPVVHIRSTVFLEHFFFSTFAAKSIAEDGTIRLPFGSAQTSPVAADDVARVAAAVLENPGPHIGKVYELTGPRAQNMDAIAQEYADALGRPVKYVDVPFDQWHDQVLKTSGLPKHVSEHILTMAKLHADNRYDRLTGDVEKITGTPAISIREYVAGHPEVFRMAASERS